MTGEQEPNGWELLRAIKGIESRLDNFAANYVPMALYNTLVDDVKELKSDLAQLRRDSDDARKTKAQLWTSIGLLFVGGVVTVLVLIFQKGAGL